MELDQRVRAALTQLSQTVAAPGQISSLPVGQANQLNGQAWYMDFPGQRFAVLASPDGQYFSCGLTHETDLGDVWPTFELEDVVNSRASWLRKSLLPTRPGPARSSITLTALPDFHYSVLEAALTQRLQSWSLTRLFLQPFTWVSPQWTAKSWPDGQPDCLGGDHYALDLSQLNLPWPVTPLAQGMDFLDFYASFPTAHGQLEISPVGFSPDRSQAVVWMKHSIGLFSSNGDRFWPTRGDLSRELPGNFGEYLMLEKTQEGWSLIAQRDPYASCPQAAPLSPEELTERLQAELCPWAEIQSVVIEDGVICQAQLQTARGIYKVLLVRSFQSSLLSLEPAIIVFGRQLSGAVIREGFENMADHGQES